MTDNAEGTLKVSKYNSAELLNMSLHGLWQIARNDCRLGNYEKWNTTLDMIWGELAGILDPNNKRAKTLFNQYSVYSTKVLMHGNLSNPAIVGFKNYSNSEKRSKQYTALLTKHLWLKRLQEVLGKGTAYKDEFEDDFE